METVRYSWDEAKNRANAEKHDVGFQVAHGFVWRTALVTEDDRYDYGEDRYIALGRIGGRLHVLVFALRDGAVRIISLRKANQREIAFYEKK